jgi:RNA polymerase sigma-70 factor (ECF subfamily)
MEFRSELSLDTIDKGKSRDIEADLALAIQDLKEEQRVCVELFFLKDKSYQDIADETGYPLQKVKSYIQNGKRNLKIFLESKQNG